MALRAIAIIGKDNEGVIKHHSIEKYGKNMPKRGPLRVRSRMVHMVHTSVPKARTRLQDSGALSLPQL